MDGCSSCLPDFYSWHASTENISFWRQVYLIDIALVCHTTKRDSNKEQKGGGQTFYFFKVVFWKLIVFLETIVVNLILSWQEQVEMVGAAVLCFCFWLLNATLFSFVLCFIYIASIALLYFVVNIYSNN